MMQVIRQGDAVKESSKNVLKSMSEVTTDRVWYPAERHYPFFNE